MRLSDCLIALHYSLLYSSIPIFTYGSQRFLLWILAMLKAIIGLVAISIAHRKLYLFGED